MASALASVRARTACASCTRRKVRCSKTTPCEACIRRGEQDSCGPEMTGPSPSQRLSMSMSNRDSMATELEYLQRRVLELESQTRQMPAENEEIVNNGRRQSHTQVTSDKPRTSRQYSQQEATATGSDDGDDGDSMEGEDGETDLHNNSNNNTGADAGEESAIPKDGRDTTDTVIKDAASILEFLAWGRRKDPEHHPTTISRRNNSAVSANIRPDARLDLERDVSVGDGSTTAVSSNADTMGIMPILPEEDDEPAASGDVHLLSWRAKNDAPFSGFGGPGGIGGIGSHGPLGGGSSGYSEPFGDNGSQHPLAVMQLLLPSRKLVEQLVDYHIDCLLWYHASFLAPRFRTDLANFYNHHGGSVEGNSTAPNAAPVDLQWVALLFAVLAGSLTSATGPQALAWGFREPERHTLCKHWFQAALACMSLDQYMANHSIYACQAIATMTISAHMLGFSNTQSIQLAAAVRIAQSLGLHRLGEDAGRQSGRASQVEAEMGRRVWNQLCSQDWFGIPFSESYLVNPLHSQTSKPANCHDEDIEAIGAGTFPTSLPESEPTVSGYCRFLNTIASIMPRLQDGLLACNTAYTRYQQVLAWDAHMRTLATADRPIFLSSQVALQPHWPVWITWARRALAISSGHKIIMIHRSCLSESFTNPAFAFTRHTCIAASKTIIKEYKAVVREEGPVLWVHQAFSVAASIILILDLLHRRPGEERQHAEHERLVEDVVGILRQFPHSMIAACWW
ncbi:hypothetical protein SBRCBS47491_003371 [Sporothrix bragantina]|uniref:Zn(2)-C6 fungal-type domain-containing protein n=1 Tax=Sporothrix bragantina TaxID=671064 RepID=A0ABP0BEY1_9PEZI